MAQLEAWFPLHVDTDDWSRNVTTKEIDTLGLVDGGMFGKCADLSSGELNILWPQRLKDAYMNSGIFAMSFFLYEYDSVGSWANLIHWHDGVYDRRWERGNVTTGGGQDMYCSIGRNDAVNGALYTNSNIAGTAKAEWNHYVWQLDGTKWYCYLNGNLLSSGNMHAPPMPEPPDMRIGGGGANSDAYMQDIRFYSETLSVKEIKDLSKGLAIHYDFNHQVDVTDNLKSDPTGDSVTNENYDPGWNAALHPNALTVSGFSSGYNSGVPDPTIGYHGQWVREGKDGSPCQKHINDNGQFGHAKRWMGITATGGNLDDLGFTTDDDIVVSWDQKVNVSGAGQNVGFYVYNTSGSRTWLPGKKTHTQTNVGQWERQEYATTIPSTIDITKNMTVYFYGHYSADGSTQWIDNVQIERRPKATKFTIGENPTATIRDSSGHEYDAGMVYSVGAPVWTKDSASGGGAFYFDDSAAYAPCNVGGSNRVTMSCWIKTSVTGGDAYHIPFNINDARYEMSISSGGSIRCGFNISGSRKVYNWGSGLLDGNWHLLTSTFDGTTMRGYIDGVQVGSATHAGTLTVGTELRMGQFYNPPASYYSKELTLDDVRVYATALSADDVKAMYETKASLSDTGMLVASEFNERLDAPLGESVNLKVIGTGGNSPNRGDSGFFVDGTRVGYRTRGINVVVFDRALKPWAYANFDLYTDDDYIIDYIDDPTTPTTVVVVDTADEKFIEFVNGIPDGYLCGFHSYDSMYTSAEINTCMSDAFGATEISKVTHSRDHYAMIAEKGGRKYTEWWKNNATTTTSDAYSQDFSTHLGVTETGVAKFGEVSEVGVTEGLVGYWDFTRGDATDLSGNGIDGTSQGAVHDGRGLIGGYYSCGDIAGKADLTGEITLVVDFVPGPHGTIDGGRTGLLETHYTHEFAVNFDQSGNVQVYKDSNQGSGGYSIHTAGAFAADERAVWIFTYALDGDGTATSHHYINGSKSGAQTIWDKVPTTHDPSFDLGRSYVGTFCDQIPGSVIRSIRAYDRALTEEEALRLNSYIANESPMSIYEDGSVSVHEIKEV
ncbi:virion structural protein [Vibrio phage D479]